MKKTKTVAFTNLVGAIIFMIICIWAWIQTGTFQEVKGSYVQAATFPRVMIIGTMIFCVVLMVQSLLKLSSMKEDDPLAAEAASLDAIHDRGVQGALAVIALCVLFAALFGTVGYIVCSAVIALAIMYMIGKRNWVQMILVSVLVPLGMWLVFYKVLTVNIPMGPLQFLKDLIDTI